MVKEMTDKFICRKCKSPPNQICYTENSSSAFPYYKLKKLKCPRGYKHVNWEYVKGVIDVFIPRNFKSEYTQKEILEDEQRPESQRRTMW